MARTTRTTLGDRFSEGARRSWVAMRERGWGASDLRAALAASAAPVVLGVGAADRYLYGDLPAPIDFAAGVEALLKVPARTWARPPSRPFVLDAAKRQARAT